MTPAPPEVWRVVFGIDRPVEIEIGPGRGDVLLAFAEQAPAVSFYGIEIGRSQVDTITERARRGGLTNVRVVAGDARCILRHLIPDRSVSAYHVYFPDPWPKRRHHHRRLFQAGVARAMARTLVPSGRVHVASDLAWLFDDMCRALEAAGFTIDETANLRARPVTRFERKYAGAGTYGRTYTPPPPD